MKDDNLILVFPGKHIQLHIDASAHEAFAQTASPSSFEFDASADALPHNIRYDTHNKSKMWLSDNGYVLFAEWIDDQPLPYYFQQKTIEIFRSESNRIKSFAFYPARRDIALIAINNGVFAIELDTRSTRNFQPIYKGKDPRFAQLDGTVYILDGDALMEADL